ncbi:HAD-IA family hydrolase [Cyanobacterium sp. uoEpiScrs1]|uniref:HAD-IA family hydrolase n=1 Tax=Cyanobacterium sp. uoEpiScrs1 TaxID=2976343 RepID=UPI00226A512F|nr:HAD-IA family hydrolase [Cyanobacterium sp. uoEpiScrs1]
MMNCLSHSFKPITHLIYDLDGLLLGTETLYHKVNQTIAQRYGKTFDPSVKAKMAGRRTQESAQLFVELLDIPLTPEEYIKERYALLYPLYATVQPLAGAKELTQHFARQGIPQAIASSSIRYHFELKMSSYPSWISCFDHFVFGDDPDLKEGKPAPDIFLLTAQRLEVDPRACLVFEDSLAGMKAAIAAGMSTVIVPEKTSDCQLFHQADQVLNSLEEFKPEKWCLP